MALNKVVVGVLATLVILPFAFLSLHYSYQKTVCASNDATKLKMWLKVDALTDLLVLALLFISIFRYKLGEFITEAVTRYGFVLFFWIGIFKVIWLIAGAFMYWAVADKTGQAGLCAPLIGYTGNRLVVCLVLAITVPLLLVCQIFFGLSPRVIA